MNRFTFVMTVTLAALVLVRASDGFEPGSWTMVVLPDTQRYTLPTSDPGLGTFNTITQWIADNKESRNIQFVLHEGDISGGNTAATWQVASNAMAILDNANVPYSMTTGNHDHDGPIWPSADSRDTLLNDYFPVSRYEAMPTYGGVFEPGKTENNYHLFSAGGKDYITLALEFGPRNEALTWADNLLTQHSDRTALIVTHVYTYADGTRYDWATKGTTQSWNPHCDAYGISAPHDGTENVNDGQEIWDELISKHANVEMVFSGHVSWAGARQEAIGDHGQVVHEMLAAYHDPSTGPTTGWIRLLEFLPDGQTVRVQTYSPKLLQYMLDGDNSFVLDVVPELATLLGDANLDSLVSADDFASVQTNYGNTGSPGGSLLGDANHDGWVGADDYASIQANFGNHLPEPATLGLLLLGGLTLLCRRRK